MNSGEVYGQPNSRLVCRVRHPMGAVSGDQNMIAGTEIALTFALNAKASQTRKEKHPFVMPLTMGLVGRHRLAS